MDSKVAKQEAIRKAYGELYEVMKENINHTTGSYLIESTHFYDKDNFYKRELFDVREYSESLLVITPKSLQGIENNNGWIRIESEEDLPLLEDESEFWISNNNGIFDFIASSLQVQRKWENKTLTHYQPIVKPEKPIY